MPFKYELLPTADFHVHLRDVCRSSSQQADYFRVKQATAMEMMKDPLMLLIGQDDGDCSSHDL